MNVKTRAISEGGIFLSLLILLLFLNLQFASSLEMLFFLLSIPYAIYGVKHGISIMVTLGFASVVITLLFSTISSLFYLGTAICVAIVLVYGFKKFYSYVQLLCFVCLTNVMISIISISLLSQVLGIDFISEVKEIQAWLQTFSLNVLYNQTQWIWITLLWVYIGVACLQAFIVQQMTLQLMQRLHLVKRIGVVQGNFRLPKWSVVLFVFSGVVMGIYPFFLFADWLYTSTLFIFIGFYYLYIVDGAISVLVLMKKRKSTKILIFILLIACFLPVIQMGIALVGIFDVVFEIRLKRKVGVTYEIHRKN